ncbi:MAG TPA: FAD-dependent oxidoreductase, partial [Thermoanaerobaculia bacterium]|nr:FAD-dependent oxidoreductase [Thermoanaerobaculia bacterium]
MSAEPDQVLPWERFGFRTADLHRPERLADLDRLFREALRRDSPALAERFERYRAGEALLPVPLSALLVEAARELGRFVAELFGVVPQRERGAAAAREETALFKYRWHVFQRRVLRKYPTAASVEGLDAGSVAARAVVGLLNEGVPRDDEAALAHAGWELFDVGISMQTPRPKDATLDPEAARARLAALRDAAPRFGFEAEAGLDDAALLAAWNDALDAHAACLHHLDHARTKGWASFLVPKKVAYDALVPTLRPNPEMPEARVGLPTHHRARDGFGLTDFRKSRRQVAGEVHYCLLCHEREKDSCSRGFAAKEGGYKKNPLGVPLKGCPLDEKISEMHLLRREGDSIGALALVTIDNPMAPGTGHRICNDCMKGCIFQLQDPVDIPQAETGVVTDVLAMPWGFEIWSLLTRWNPLNAARPYTLPYNGKNVLVVGLGPAGYTLAHHLLNEGFGVAGIDGLKVEPLPADLTGTDESEPRPIRDSQELFRPLDGRALTGFGGVSEYGITVRWDKNFLDILYLNLARRRTFRVYGGVRFGGTLTFEQACDLGFDHVAVAAGAGKPTLVEMKNNLIRGVRKASDFLMALQLTGAFKREALANLHLELPVIVIGGGLTGIDTATESLAYYPIHAEKTLERFETMSKEIGEPVVLAGLLVEERAALGRILEHGRAIRSERLRAARAGETPDYARLCRIWGGSTLAYRRAMEESPAYRLNHEEILKALEEGIVFAENLDPLE